MAVYLIQAGNQPIVKIGKADCPLSRLNQHQAAHWEELKIIRLWVGGHSEEAMLHIKFSDLHIRGEWYSLSKAMMGDVGLIEITDINIDPPTKAPLKAPISPFLTKWTGEQRVRLADARREPTAAVPDEVLGASDAAASLMIDVEGFLQLSGMTATSFGIRSVSDPKLVHEMRRGRECKRSIRDRVVQFIASEASLLASSPTP